MNIAVVGLGGVGGYFGGKIARKYARSPEHRVVFIARGEHLAAMREKGLRLMTVAEDFTVVPDLSTDRPAEAGPCDLVLICVKEYDLTAAAADIAPLVHENTAVLPLLNGVDIAERLRPLLPRGTVLGGCVYISSYVDGPGTVRQAGGSCRLFFGPVTGPPGGQVEPYRPLETFLTAAGIQAELSPEIALPLWTKYLFVSPLAGVTSLMKKSFGGVMADEKGRVMVRGLMEEIARLARARGIMLPADSVEAALAQVARFPYETKSSLQLDYEKGRRTEVDLFTGYAVRAGRALGVPMPIHEELYTGLLHLDNFLLEAR